MDSKPTIGKIKLQKTNKPSKMSKIHQNQSKNHSKTYPKKLKKRKSLKRIQKPRNLHKTQLQKNVPKALPYHFSGIKSSRDLRNLKKSKTIPVEGRLCNFWVDLKTKNVKMTFKAFSLWSLLSRWAKVYHFRIELGSQRRDTVQ